MPKSAQKPTLHIDLLHPESNPEHLYKKIISWLLSTGRYIIVFVELIVLCAFVARFKLDADLAYYKESIEEQIPYIESLKTDEHLIRQLQKQLSNIRELKTKSYDFSWVFKVIATQTPQGIKLSNVNLDNNQGKVDLKIIGTAQNINELATLLFGLKESPGFGNITLANVGLDKDTISFTITGVVNILAINQEQNI